MPQSAVVTLMQRFKADLARNERATQQEMVRRWLAVERRLSGQMSALALEMTARHAAGIPVTTTMLMNDVRYRELMIQLQDELATYTQYANRTITDNQRDMAQAGVQQSQQAIAVQLPAARSPQFAASFNRLPISAVEHMAGITGAGTPLNSLLVQSWPLSAQGITQALVEGVALGYNPRKVARNMAEGATGSLNRMMVISRSETLRVYRESSKESWRTSGIVLGYRRLATHDRRTCSACLMDEGHFYTLDEEMPLHPQDRCVGVPVVEGAPEITWLRGEDRFMTQDSEVQESILGKGHFEGWRTGRFELSDLVKVQPNPIWGPSLQVRPLKELL